MKIIEQLGKFMVVARPGLNLVRPQPVEHGAKRLYHSTILRYDYTMLRHYYATTPDADAQLIVNGTNPL